MKLNKIFAIALCALCFTACSDDDDEPKSNVTPGFFSGKTALVLNQGNMYGNIPGSLSKLNLENGSVLNNAFKDVNGRVLGDTPQCAMIYGSKLYVGVYQSNAIEVIDPITLKLEKTISLGSTAKEPRGIAAKDGYVYFSMYDGYVARLDTLSLSIDKTVKVGPNPEQIGIAENYLYVTNSDGMNSNNDYVNGKTVSKINLSTFTEEKKIEVGMNPTKLVTNGNDIFVICMGNYAPKPEDLIPSMLMKINADDSVEELYKATLMAINGNSLYTINAPYGDSNISYTHYSINNKKITNLSFSNIISPIGIGINPSNGNILISSYSTSDWNAYQQPCYVNEYTSDATFNNRYDVGIEATCFVF